MATKSKTSFLPKGLSLSINSPRFVKSFKVLVVVLILASAGYGIYTLVSERLSSAAGSTYTASHKSIGHTGGQLWLGLDGRVNDWRADPNNKEQQVWWGPYRKLSGKKQYLACFEYANGGDPQRPPVALISVTNDIGKQVLRQEKVSPRFQAGKSTGYDKTCLAFYLKKQANSVEFKFKHISGTMLIRSTNIRGISKSEAYNFLHDGQDNSTVLFGFGYDTGPERP